MRSSTRLPILALLAAIAHVQAAAADCPTSGPPELLPTIDVHSCHPDIVAKAEALGTPLEIYRFVRNEIEFEVYHGSMKGALGTLWSKKGNDFDQASLLIALLRARGIKARYVIGIVDVDQDQLMQWTGTRNQNAADTAFWEAYCGGRNNFGQCIPPVGNFQLSRFVLFGNGASRGVRMEHAWV
ncbi:MAG: transglutaminase-like domain-containing protein, partial [Vicinamibacteria bacterium]